MKVVAIVQARLNSKRLPGKVMKQICGIPMIGLLLRRLSLSKKIDEIVIATSDHKSNQKLIEYIQKEKYQFFIGSEENVLERYYNAAKKYNADTIVRVTADNPLTDPKLVDYLDKTFEENNNDLVTTSWPPTYPWGLTVEVMSLFALKKCYESVNKDFDKEHVTTYIKSSGKFNILNVKCDKDYSNQRLTVDEEDDFQVVKSVFEYFQPNINFDWTKIKELLNKKPELFEKNRHISSNFPVKNDSN